MSDICKWLSDDFNEICVNVDCPYLAEFCPSTEHPKCCVHFEPKEGKNDGNNESDA